MLEFKKVACLSEAAIKYQTKHTVRNQENFNKMQVLFCLILLVEKETIIILYKHNWFNVTVAC